MSHDDFTDLDIELDEVNQVIPEPANSKLEKRRKIEEIFEEKRLRRELEDVFD